MGPTQTSQPTLLLTPSSYESNLPLESEMMTFEFEIDKIEVSEETLANREGDLKVIVAEIQKLTKHKLLSPYLPNYKKVWFEGPLLEKCNTLTGLPKAKEGGHSDSPSRSFLCIKREKYDSTTLENWLEDRKDCSLSESQILHIILQLASAVNLVLELGLVQKKSLSLADIYVVYEQQGDQDLSHFTPNLYPNVKLSVYHFEALLNSLKESSSPVIRNEGPSKTESLLQFLARTFAMFLQMNICDVASCPPKYPPEEWNIIQEMNSARETNNMASCANMVSKLQQLKSRFKHGFSFNIAHPAKLFVGRESELKSLVTIVTESRNKIIVIHGSPGMGKSELVTQLSRRLLDRKRESGSAGDDVMNIICFDASSVDNLTKSVYACARQKKLKIDIKDYMGNSRLLKDIFLEMLSVFNESDLLVMFDNADILMGEILDLIQMFKESVNCQSNPKAHHHLILVTREIWTSCPLLEDCDCTTLSLTEIKREEAISILKTRQQAKLSTSSGFPMIISDETLEKVCEALHYNPAALKIISEYSNSWPDLPANMEMFKSKFPEIHHISPDLQPICLAATFILFHFHATLPENEKLILENLVNLFQFVDGDTGISLQTVTEVVMSNSQTAPEDVICSLISSLLSSLRQFSLLRITDNVIRLSYWAQFAIRSASKIIVRKNADCCDVSSLISSYFIVLSSKSLESDCWRIIGHAAKLWKEATKSNYELVKRFDALPELIAKLAKSFKKVELVAGFLKESVDIFTRVYGSSHDIHVLKLKYLLAMNHLLPKGKVNEAFIVLKSIHENCSLEPRECLMIKLKSLIELGKIHISRQEYEKAISCCQHVQVFSVQKISILQLDSEPTVLCSRVLHGQAHLQQGNAEEAKKIILQVIPLLERYSGPELDTVRLMTIQAKFYLAVILRKMGDLVNALMLQTKVLEDRERIFGNKHPDTWDSMQEMSLLFSSYDNHEKALLLLRQLLDIQEDVLGAPSNRHSLATMNAIADIEAKLGNFDDALELYEAIDLIEQQVLPENDDMRISSQISQAEVLMSLGQYKEAIDIFDLVYALRSTSVEEKGVSSSHAKLLEDVLRRREKAERSMEVLGNYWLSLTPENVDDPSELAALAKKHEVAVQLTENQDNQGALRFLREVLEDCGHLEETNRFHLNVKADLARVLGLVGRFNESFSVYKEIIPLMDATFGETDELTMLCKDTMGQVFLFSGNQFLKRQMSNLKWFLL